MKDKIIIAVDAMGGEGAPKKVIDGIIFHNKKINNIFISKYFIKNIITFTMVQFNSIDYFTW